MPNKSQTALRESDPIPEKLIMPVGRRDWQECCVMNPCSLDSVMRYEPCSIERSDKP